MVRYVDVAVLGMRRLSTCSPILSLNFAETSNSEPNAFHRDTKCISVCVWVADWLSSYMYFQAKRIEYYGVDSLCCGSGYE